MLDVDGGGGLTAVKMVKYATKGRMQRGRVVNRNLSMGADPMEAICVMSQGGCRSAENILI